MKSVSETIHSVPSSEKTLLLLNLEESWADQLTNMLEDVFTDATVTVARRDIPEGTGDLVCLVEEGTVVATSPWSELRDSFLLINSDSYRTGTKQFTAKGFPDVLTGLDEVAFDVRGYPNSNKQKLLLVLISRFIEFRALSAGVGTLDTAFQELSRLDDEYGTRRVYEWLADSDVGTHVYGRRDDSQAVEGLDVQVHDDNSNELADLWFVIYRPPADAPETPDAGPAALLAEETAENRWRGTWTYDPARVDAVQAYVRETF